GRQCRTLPEESETPNEKLASRNHGRRLHIGKTPNVDFASRVPRGQELSGGRERDARNQLPGAAKNAIDLEVGSVPKRDRGSVSAAKRCGRRQKSAVGGIANTVDVLVDVDLGDLLALRLF